SSIGNDTLNSVSGKVYYDRNDNQVFDANDLAIKNQMVVVNDGEQIAFTDTAGNYKFLRDASSMEIRLQNPPRYSTVDPAEHIINFTGSGMIETGKDFVVVFDSTVVEVAIDITPMGP